MGLDKDVSSHVGIQGTKEANDLPPGQAEGSVPQQLTWSTQSMAIRTCRGHFTEQRNILGGLDVQGGYLFTITSTVELSPLTVATAKETTVVSTNSPK